MLASIDSPQGDQVDLTPAAAATAMPTRSRAVSAAKIALRRRREAGVTGGDAGVLELGVDAARVVPPLDVGRPSADWVRADRARGPVGVGLAEQSKYGRPVRAGALAGDPPGRSVHVDEVRRAGNLVGLPCRVGRDDLESRSGELAQPRLALLLLDDDEQPRVLGEVDAGAESRPEGLARRAAGGEEGEQRVVPGADDADRGGRAVEVGADDVVGR